MTMTLDDLYAQMLGAVPPEEAALVEGAPPMAPPVGAPWSGMAFPEFALGGGMPGGQPPESAQVDPMLGVNPNYGAQTTAPAMYGYSPQPRPMLPPQIAEPDPAADLYGPFRDVWQGMQGQAEQDPLAALMQPPPREAGPQTPWGPAGERTLPPASPFEGPPFGQPDAFVAQPGQGGERVLHGRGYGRVLDRVNWLRGLRAQRGY
jgi:hypothetical protein